MSKDESARSTSPMSAQFKMDLGARKHAPMPMTRSLSAASKRDIKVSTEHNSSSNSRTPSFAELTEASPSTSSPSTNSKQQPPAAAPLNDAAAQIVSFVSSAERSIVKAFTFVKKPASSSAAACSQPFPLTRDPTFSDDVSGEQDQSAKSPRPKSRNLSGPIAAKDGGRRAGGKGDAESPTPESSTRSVSPMGDTRPVKFTKSDSGPTLGSAEDKSDVVVGVLSKWINIGRGWGPRLFVLEGGVLSYFKLDGPDKVSVRVEVHKHKNPLLVGDEIRRWMQREREKEVEKGRPTSAHVIPIDQKPLGSIHLLVANLRESNSDDKKFYIYSGTKTLDLRGETKEDRDRWMEILEGAKRKVDESMRELEELEDARSVLVAVREDAVQKLLNQLRHAGLAKEKVEEFEAALRNDVVGLLQEKLREEQRRRWQLQRRIKVLETEKAQLETTVVHQTRNAHSSGVLAPIDDGMEGENLSEGAEEEEELELPGGAHGDEDDDGDDNFFETLSDFMESGRFDTEGSQHSALSLDMEKVGFEYPEVPRRSALPVPAEVEKPVSLWDIIKDCVGKDVSRITLPVFFNEPISTLQKCAEEMEYSWLLDRAAVYGNHGNQLMRALHVAAFALSGYACTEGRVQKPFNPLLGETYEAEYPDKGWRFFAEKMQHNPNVVACHCEGRGWRFWGDCNMRIRFWGPSMQLDPLGVLSVEFEDGERYEWAKVTTGIYNLILGRLYIDHYGTMAITSNRNGMSVLLKFKERSIFDRNVHQVHGFAQDSSGTKLATLIGKWSEHLHFVPGDAASGPAKASDQAFLDSAQLLWKANPRSEHAGKYKFTPFAVTLNEITPGLQEHLPPTDSRLRPDQRLLEEGRYEKANQVKLRLEQRQRLARKSGEPGWHGRWFEQRGPHNTWTYTGKYWDRRSTHDWSGVKDLFADDQDGGATTSSSAQVAPVAA